MLTQSCLPYTAQVIRTMLTQSCLPDTAQVIRTMLTQSCLPDTAQVIRTMLTQSCLPDTAQVIRTMVTQSCLPDTAQVIHFLSSRLHFWCCVFTFRLAECSFPITSSSLRLTFVGESRMAYECSSSEAGSVTTVADVTRRWNTRGPNYPSLCLRWSMRW